MSAFKILTGKPTGNRPLGRPRHAWEDNVRMYLKEIGISTRNQVQLRIGIIGKPFECGIEPLISINHGVIYYYYYYYCYYSLPNYDKLTSSTTLKNALTHILQNICHYLHNEFKIFLMGILISLNYCVCHKYHQRCFQVLHLFKKYSNLHAEWSIMYLRRRNAVK